MSSVRFRADETPVLTAQATAEDRAWAANRDNYGVSFKQGHRTGWRDFADWAVRTAGPIHWETRVTETRLRLLAAGIARTGRDIDLAIDSARSALHDDDTDWADPDTTNGWAILEPHVLRFLDLTDDELQAVA